jgi:AhpD family alkylhydroperoxidase
MQSRIANPAISIPNALQHLMALGEIAKKDSVPAITLSLTHLRASQINGCSVCVDMHSRMLKNLGETDERLYAVAAWRDAPYFTEAERAALALTEAATRLNDRDDPVPDDIWNEATLYYDEPQLALLTFNIAFVNFWNRLNVPTRQVAGEFFKSAEAKKWQKEHAAVAH